MDPSNPLSEILDCGGPAHDILNPQEPYVSVCYRANFTDVIQLSTTRGNSGITPEFDIQNRQITLYIDIVAKPERIFDSVWSLWTNILQFEVWLKDKNGVF